MKTQPQLLTVQRPRIMTITWTHTPRTAHWTGSIGDGYRNEHFFGISKFKPASAPRNTFQKRQLRLKGGEWGYRYSIGHYIGTAFHIVASARTLDEAKASAEAILAALPH